MTDSYESLIYKKKLLIVYLLYIFSNNSMHPSFLAFKAVICTWLIDLQWLFHSIHVVPNRLAYVIIQLNVNVNLLTVDLSTFKDSESSWSVLRWSWPINSSNSSSSIFFGWPQRSLSFTLKSPLLNYRNHSLHHGSDRACSR